MKTIRVAIANTYVGNKKPGAYRQHMAGLGVHVIGTSEAQRAGRIRGYIRHGAPAGEDRFTREVAIYVRDGIRVDGVTWRNLTIDVGGNAHVRSAVEARLRLDGTKWALIQIHSNPSRFGRAAKQNASYMRSVRGFVRAAEADGYRVVVMGDFNRTRVERGPSTPYWLAQQIDGILRLAHIDGLVAGPGVAIAQFKKMSAPPGSDHPLVLATLRAVASKV